MKHKHFLSLALMLALVLMLTLLPIRAEAATVASGKCGDNLTWVLDDQGTLTISGTGSMGNNIPWRDYANNITKVIMKDGVTSIEDSAFNDCVNLTGVTIPNSVTSIGNWAFYNCESLTAITIPNGVTFLGERVFSSCSRLTSVNIPDGVKEIDYQAFYECTSLTSVEIPNSVTYIDMDAFFGCTNLTNVTIGNSVRYISSFAFCACTSLTNVTIPDSVISIGGCAFSQCTSLTSVTIPDSVTSIGYSAFYKCASLTRATIGNGVTTIGDYAFNGCDILETVCYSGTSNQWNTISIGADNTGLTYADIHYNENQDHNCDVCNTVFGTCKDSNQDGICDICGKHMPLPVPTKPHKIANVVSGVHVYWKEVPGAAKYGLFRSETGKTGTYKWIANPTVPHFTDTKVTSGKTYYYKVTTVSAAGNHSEKSEPIGATYVATPDITSRINKAAGITVGWNKITGATGYAIYRKSYSGNDAWVRVGTIVGNKTFTWTDTSVKSNNGTAYKYTVRALAGSDMKTLSGCRNAGRSMVRLASRTISSAVKNGATSIKCSWTTSSAVTGYEVRFMVGSTVYKTFTIGNYKTGVKTFTGLKTGQTYKIQVRSYVKIDGMGFYSAWSTAKTVTLP